MQKVVIVGSGGHAKVIIDIFRSAGVYEPLGCTDVLSKDKKVAGVPVLGDDSILPKLFSDSIKYAFIALGDNAVRARLAKRVKEIGFELVNAVSPHSYVSASARMGSGIAIMPGAVVNPEATIGDNVIINTGASVDHDCVIEAFCHIAPGCSIAGNVKIGRGSLLGIGSVVIPNVTVGEWSVLGAGSVVTCDLPGRSVALGFPAKVVKELRGGT